MAKVSAVQKNKRRERLVAKDAAKRAELKAKIKDQDISPEERFEAVMRLAELPRNGSKVRVRNRCELSGRPRGTYRKFKLGRVMLRDLASTGQIPGMVKSSW
ncbi:30S ribosomal protein S14 [Caenispirillum salinarum]|uniref:30S ribosomal protein S14 n=1 Tax=Caenispirillum salinarum TaxID=859058 RepID=UPI00384C17F1